MTCLETNHSSRTASFRKRIKSETHLASDLYFINYCKNIETVTIFISLNVLHSVLLPGPDLQA